MIKIFYLLAFLIFCFSAKGQVSDTTSKRNDTVIKLICKTTVQKQKPLYIVLLHKNQIEITNLESFSSSIGVNWIENIKVLKGDNAIKEYGKKAENGAIVIKIKPEYIEKIKEKINKNKAPH
ncbi:MAG: hypothetical protein ABGW91_00245 [Christiangramia sp.]|tara:strand:- start:20 stop:385 length:366 start_codon:yes stop_codon:yes gene_type:complete